MPPKSATLFWFPSNIHYLGLTLGLLLLLHPFNGLFSRTTWVCRYQKGKPSLDLNEARDAGILGCSGISWTICKRSTPRSREMTTPTPHHSIFTDRMLFLTPNQQRQSTEGTRSQHKMATRSVQPFLQGSQLCPTHTHTHTHTQRPQNISNNRLHLTLCIAMPLNNTLSLYTHRHCSRLVSRTETLTTRGKVLS